MIISKDSDFDNVIKFWRDETHINATRAEKIKTSARVTVRPKQKPMSGKTNLKINASERMKINNEIIQILNKAGLENKIAGSAASIAVKNINKDNRKKQIYEALVSKFGQERGLKIYKNIKECIS